MGCDILIKVQSGVACVGEELTARQGSSRRAHRIGPLGSSTGIWAAGHLLGNRETVCQDKVEFPSSFQ